MVFFKRHTDTLAIIAVICGGLYWTDSKFEKVNDKIALLEKEVGDIKTEVSQVKTVLIIRGMMPESMATGETQ